MVIDSPQKVDGSGAPQRFADGKMPSGNTFAMNNRVKKYYADLKKAKQKARREHHSAEPSPAIPAPYRKEELMNVREFEYIRNCHVGQAQYYGVGYDGIRKPLVYDSVEAAILKHQQLHAKRRTGLRVKLEPMNFDEAQFYSMYGDSIPYDRRSTYEFQAERAYLLRKRRGEDQGTDVSTADETSPTSPGANSSSSGTSPTAPRSTPIRFIGSSQSALGRTEKRKKAQRTQSRHDNETDEYHCPTSDREFKFDGEDLEFRTPNPRVITGRNYMNQLEDMKPLDSQKKSQLKDDLKHIVLGHVMNPSFNHVIGDQMARFAVRHFAHEEHDISTPPGESNSDDGVPPAPPLSVDVVSSVQDDTVVPGDDAHGDDESLATHSAIGRLTRTRQEVEQLNRKGLALSLPKFAPEPRVEKDAKESEITPLDKEVEEAALAEEICTIEAINRSMELTEITIGTASSSADATAGTTPSDSDTINDAMLAQTIAEDDYDENLYGFVTLDYRPEPKIFFMTQLAENTPAPPWSIVKDHWERQRLRLSHSGKKTGVQIERLRQIIAALIPREPPPKRDVKKDQLWDIILEHCRTKFHEDPNLFTIDIQEYIGTAHDLHRDAYLAMRREQEAAFRREREQKIVHKSHPVTPSVIYQTKIPQAPPAPKLSASQLAILDVDTSGTARRPLPEDDAASVNSAQASSIGPSDSASVAQSISTVRPAFRIPLDSLPEEGRTPMEIWQDSVKPQASPDAPPERSSGSTKTTIINYTDCDKLASLGGVLS